MSNSPVFAQFFARIESTVERLGIVVEDTKGWIKLVSPVNDHKVYVQMTADKLPRIDTTLPIAGTDAGIPLDKPNGRIASHIIPDPDVVIKVLETFMVDPAIKLPKTRRSKAAGATPSLDELLGKAAVAAAEEPAPAPSDEELEALTAPEAVASSPTVADWTDAQ